MSANPILAEICRKSNKRHELYLELGHLIEGSSTFGFFDPQVDEIKKLNQELTQLWRKRRAEGKIWTPRLREGHHSRRQYERQLTPGAHGYR